MAPQSQKLAFTTAGKAGEDFQFTVAAEAVRVPTDRKTESQPETGNQVHLKTLRPGHPQLSARPHKGPHLS